MELTGLLASWPGSILDVPFPFDDATPLDLSGFVSEIVRTQVKMGISSLRVT